MRNSHPDVRVLLCESLTFSLDTSSTEGNIECDLWTILMKKANIITILRSPGTVFTFRDVLLASGETSPTLLKRRINHYIMKGELYPIRRGIYGKDKNYNRFELATKIYTPSYISFETVLSREGMIFQHYSQIFLASYLTREIECDNQAYVFRRLKQLVLTNPLGIEQKENLSIASRERAFLDMLYLHGDFYFDNLSQIAWDKCFEMILIYRNKAMAKRLDSYFKQAKHA